jgi:hypothetical protein
MHGHGNSRDTLAWADGEYEIWPLPKGEVSVTAAWPLFGLGPATVTLARRLLREAAGRARAPWNSWPVESLEAFESIGLWFT